MSQIDDLRTLVEMIKADEASKSDVIFGIIKAADTIKRLARICMQLEFVEDLDEILFCPLCGKYYGAMFEAHFSDRPLVVNHVAELAGDIYECNR